MGYKAIKGDFVVGSTITSGGPLDLENEKMMFHYHPEDALRYCGDDDYYRYAFVSSEGPVVVQHRTNENDFYGKVVCNTLKIERVIPYVEFMQMVFDRVMNNEPRCWFAREAFVGTMLRRGDIYFLNKIFKSGFYRFDESELEYERERGNGPSVKWLESLPEGSLIGIGDALFKASMNGNCEIVKDIFSREFDVSDRHIEKAIRSVTDHIDKLKKVIELLEGYREEPSSKKKSTPPSAGELHH